MKWGRVILVIFGAVLITALGIDAADTVGGKDGTLLSQVIRSDKGVCPLGMAEVANIPNVTCVDIYEVSTGKECPVPDPENLVSSMKNIENEACIPESKAGVTPWRFITRDQAMQACARVGKRLPSSAEWYALSLGMVNMHDACNIKTSSVSPTGAYTGCKTPHGAYDMVGNVWEWVSDDVIDGKYKEQQLPPEGYVAQVDQGGMATVSVDTAQLLFGSDYFWSQQEGSFGIIRGGYYDSGTDAGIYTIHADTLPTSASVGIGFRCVM
jgi:hypothetical protein